MLTTLDKMFLFALDDEKCTLLRSVASNLNFGLRGALLADLALQEKVGVLASHELTLLDSNPLDDVILDVPLHMFQKSRQRKASYWLKHPLEDLVPSRKRLLERLVSAQILKQEEDQEFSWVLPYAGSQNPNASAKYILKSHLRELVLTCGEPELDELALLGLLKASRLLNLVFTKGERKAAQQWVYAALMSKSMADPIARTLQEINMAVEVLIANE